MGSVSLPRPFSGIFFSKCQLKLENGSQLKCLSGTREQRVSCTSLQFPKNCAFIRCYYSKACLQWYRDVQIAFTPRKHSCHSNLLAYKYIFETGRKQLTKLQTICPSARRHITMRNYHRNEYVSLYTKINLFYRIKIGAKCHQLCIKLINKYVSMTPHVYFSQKWLFVKAK